MTFVRAGVVAICLVTVLAGCGATGKPPIEVGVLLPVSGPGANDFETPLEWALDNVNKTTIGGRHIKLVYEDTAKTNVIAAARTLAEDPKIVAVVGPSTSDDVYAVADLFIEANKPLVPPSATSAGIFRDFAHSGDVWRTVESDVAQTQAMLELARRQGAKRVALITGTDLYGQTFFDWFGFLADELGLQVTASVRYDQTNSCLRPLAKATAANPDVLLAVPSTTATTVCIAKNHGSTRVLFSDGGEDSAAGAALDGMSGVTLAPAAGNGFANAFRAKFHEAPTPYAANTYDALTLIAYGLARGGDRAIAHAVDGRGASTSWDATGIRQAITALEHGGSPNVNGATGDLTYDSPLHTDPVSSTYAAWTDRNGTFVTTPLHRAAHATAAARMTPQRARRGKVTASNNAPPPRGALWAVLVAASDGLQNYRHQADVLAQYQVLRSRGVPDSHIVLIMSGDVARAYPGHVPYYVGGPTLDHDVHIDYRLEQVTAAKFNEILEHLPSGPNDDVYVYIAGHGDEKGVYFGLNQPIPTPGVTVFTPSALAEAAAAMKYRRLLVAVEACESGALGEDLHSQNALLLTAAGPFENSIATNYDTKTQTWLADTFSFALWRAETQHPAETLESLYDRLYDSIAGQHVSIYGRGFDGTSTLAEFTSR